MQRFQPMRRQRNRVDSTEKLIAAHLSDDLIPIVLEYVHIFRGKQVATIKEDFSVHSIAVFGEGAAWPDSIQGARLHNCGKLSIIRTQKPVHALVALENGLLATIDRQGILSTWSLLTGECVMRKRLYHAPERTFLFALGHTIAVRQNNDFAVFDSTSGETLVPFGIFVEDSTCMAAADGYIFAGTETGAVRMFGVASRQIVGRFEHGAAITGLTTLPNDLLVVSTRAGTVHVWDVALEIQVKNFTGLPASHMLGAFDDFQIIIAHKECLMVLDLNGEKHCVEVFNHEITALAVNSSQVVVCCSNGLIRVFQ